MSLPLAWSERRKDYRAATLSPIRFEWIGDGGELLRARGLTRDVSWKGVYAYVEQPLAVGSRVEADLIYPVELTDSEPLMFRCECRVLRSERFESRFSAALLIESHHLIRAARFYRRAYLRVSVSQMTARYAGGQGAVRDLSQTGAFIESRLTLSLDRKVELRLQNTRRRTPEIIVEAIVRRVDPQVGMGVEFVALSEENNRRLQDLVAGWAKQQQ